MNWRTTIMALTTLTGLLLAAGAANAHVRKNTWLVQGNVAFSSSSGDLYGNENLTLFDLSPAAHCFLANKLALGGKLDYASEKQGDFSNSSLLIGPSLHYYLARDLDAKVNPYLGAAILLSSDSHDNGVVSDSRSGSTIQLAAGLAWFWTEHLALTPELSFNLENLDGDNGTTIMLGAGLAGFLYHPTNHNHAGH